MIAVLDYGIGNLRSAQKALQHVGADAHLVTSPREAKGAAGVVLPGVGAFGACMSALRESGLDATVFDAVGSGTPFLGICVGMQMLFDASEESPGVAGLGVLPGAVRRITGDVKLPQMQWNQLHFNQLDHDQLDHSATSPLLSGLEEAWCYFVHSYAVELTDDVIATCEYGEKITAMVQRDHLWATQFHPEKSSSSGLRLLENFVEQTKQTGVKQTKQTGVEQTKQTALNQTAQEQGR